MIIYRLMTPQDFRKVFELCKDSFPDNPISMGCLNYLLFCNDTLDFSLYWLACKGETIVGAACAAMDYNGDTGYIQFVAVKRDFRRQGIATSLVEKLLCEFSGRGVAEVIFSGYSRNYLTPGLDAKKYPLGLALFNKFDFSPLSRPVSMEIILESYQAPQLNISKDFRIVPFEDEHFASVLCLSKEHLQPEWMETIQKGYLKGNYSCKGFVCLDQGENVIGFAFYGMVGDDARRFGPIGINPNYRGKSLGAVLLHACLGAQKEAGHDKSYFLWGDEGSAAVEMYKKNGFTVFSSMIVLRKQLSQKS